MEYEFPLYSTCEKMNDRYFCYLKRWFKTIELLYLKNRQGDKIGIRYTVFYPERDTSVKDYVCEELDIKYLIWEREIEEYLIIKEAYKLLSEVS